MEDLCIMSLHHLINDSANITFYHYVEHRVKKRELCASTEPAYVVEETTLRTLIANCLQVDCHFVWYAQNKVWRKACYDIYSLCKQLYNKQSSFDALDSFVLLGFFTFVESGNVLSIKVETLRMSKYLSKCWWSLWKEDWFGYWLYVI